MSAVPAALALFLVACASHGPAAAPARPAEGPTPAAIGETFTIESKVLGEKRVINVYLPPDYGKDANVRYPVLYMPDGGLAEDFPHVVGSVDVSIKNAVIPPMIVVGVENTERRRDLVAITNTPEEQKAAPHAGGADNFRRFFREELKPYIAAHYRTTAESGLIGESLAGLFVIETFLLEPSLFDNYIAVDPSLQWNDGALLQTANARIVDFTGTPKRLYFTTGDYPDMVANGAALASSLRILAPRGLTWTYEPMPSEHHNTIFGVMAVRGIRTLFAL